MNKKGFTLIELLAVIVILAIIALIATPIILNVIDTAKKGAKESSVLGYVDAIEKQVMMSQVDTSATDIPAGTYSVSQLTTLKVEVKGEKPVGTSVVIINSKGQVTEGWFTFKDSDYKVYYDGKKAAADKEDYLDEDRNKHNEIGTPSVIDEPTPDPTTPTAKTYTVGEAINYNPTTNQTCENPVSTTGTKTGCMKWYVIKDNGDSINVILDHNTTATVAYNTSGTYVEYNSASIKNQVNTDTTGWTSGLNPRLITANEIATITENTTFNGSSSTYFYFGSNNTTNYSSQTEEQKARQRSFAWLFDYTYNCTNYGCNTADSSTSGYWTSSSGTSSDAWSVLYYGYLFNIYVGGGGSYGVRPVITIPKSTFN